MSVTLSKQARNPHLMKTCVPDSAATCGVVPPEQREGAGVKGDNRVDSRRHRLPTLVDVDGVGEVAGNCEMDGLVGFLARP